MSLQEATEYLKHMDEWWTLRNMDRETVLAWAHYLYNHEMKKPEIAKDTTTNDAYPTNE